MLVQRKWPESAQSEEFEADIVSLLEQIGQLKERLVRSLRSSGPDTISDTAISELVQNILRCRRRRDKFFGGELFGEPAWDILLELYAAERTDRKLSVSGACYASGVPHSTALRWIMRLERDGWIQRVDDPRDGRRSWLVLSPNACERIRECLSQMAASM